jgi:uncharacterized membrane protein YphA (DoxX/SURF4 family)
MSLPPLNIRINGDTRDLEQSIERVQSELSGLQSATQSIAGGFRSFGDTATNLGRSMLPVSGAISAAAGGMFLLAQNTANVGDEIAKTAMAIGVETAALQELRFAIGQATNIGEEGLNVMLQTLTRRMGEAVAGNDTYAQSLASLGVSVEDIASGAITTDEVFTRLAAAMASAETTAQASAMGMDLLGRSGASMGGQLRESGADIAALRDRAQELGIVMSGEALAASEQYADQMDEVTRQMRAARLQIGTALLPVALGLAAAFQDKVVPAIVSLAERVEGIVSWFGQLPGPVQEAASVIAGALGVGGPVLMAVGMFSRAISGLLLATGPIGLLIGAATLAASAWAVWGDDIKQIVGEAVDWISEKFNGIVEFFTGLPERFMQFGRDIIDGLRAGIDSAWEAVKASIAEKIDWLPNWVKERLGIASPSRVFMEIGENIGQGMAAGIQSTFGMVRDASRTLADQAIGSAVEMASGVVGAMGQMFEGSKPIAIAQALIDTYQGVTKALAQGGWFGIVRAAAVAAKGFAAVASIRATRPGSGASASSAGSFTSGASGMGSSQMQQMPTQTLRFDFGGQNSMGMEQLVDMLNDAHDRGYRIRAVMA